MSGVFVAVAHMSYENNPGCLECIGDEILPSYVGIIS